MGKGTHQDKKHNTCYFESPFRPSSFWNFGTFYSGGYIFAITLLGYGSMSLVETDEEEAFSILIVTLTLERVRRVTGPRTTSVNVFMVTGSSMLMGVALYVGWPLLDATVGGVGSGSGLFG